MNATGPVGPAAPPVAHALVARLDRVGGTFFTFTLVVCRRCWDSE